MHFIYFMLLRQRQDRR